MARLADFLTSSRPESEEKKPPVSVERVRAFIEGTSVDTDARSDVHLFFCGDVLIGYEKTRRETWASGARAYHVAPFVHPEWRKPEILIEISRHIVQYHSAFARLDPRGSSAFLSVVPDSSDAAMTGALAAAGFRPRHHFLQMSRPVDGDLAPRKLPLRLEVRPLRQAEHRAVYEFDRRIMGDHWGIEAPSERHYRWWSEEAFRNPELWRVAWDGEAIVGTAAGVVGGTWNPAVGGDTAEIRFVRVSPEWRRRGVASALVLQCLAALRERGIRKVILGVDGNNETTAAALYRTLGFEVVSRTVAYCRDLAPYERDLSTVEEPRL